jgi:putative spermidine/putrescine transport system substrate-binding protein
MKRASLVPMVGLLIGLGWAGPAATQTKELVVAAWGDPYEAGWRKALVPAFEKKYGVKITWVQGFSTQTLAKLRAQKDNPQIDVAMMDDGPHRQAATLGLVERIDRSKLSNARDLYDVAFEPEDYGIGFAVAGYGLYYNTKAFADNKWAPPTSWLDLFRPEFKGKVSVHNIGNANGMFLLLALNKIAGGTESNVEPGFAKLKELVPHVVTFDKFGETPTLIQQGSAVIGTWNIDRVVNLAATGVPVKFVYPKEGIWGIKEVITIVKGRPNQDLAYKFIDMILSPEEQVNTAKFIGLGSLHKQAKLDDETAGKVIYGPEAIAKMTIPNWQVVNANRAAWTERWNKEIERKP